MLHEEAFLATFMEEERCFINSNLITRFLNILLAPSNEFKSEEVREDQNNVKDSK